MKTLPRDEQDELWNKFWDEMRLEWFKLEVLQDYTGEDDGPSLQAWLKGDTKSAIQLLNTDDDPQFTSDCRDKLAKGVKLFRVHIIEQPLSPYMEWETQYYKHISVPLRGEQVFYVYKSDAADLDLPKGDLMVFDGRRAIVNSYDQNGLVIQANFYDEHDDIGDFLELQKALKSYAKPLPDLQATRPLGRQ